MGVAYYIATEQRNPGFPTLVSGKTVARSIEELDELATSLQIAPLSGFISMSGEDLSNLLGDDASQGDVPEVKWFEPSELLASVRALAKAVTTSKLSGFERLAAELSEYAHVLENAVAAKCRVRLAVDL